MPAAEVRVVGRGAAALPAVSGWASLSASKTRAARYGTDSKGQRVGCGRLQVLFLIWRSLKCIRDVEFAIRRSTKAQAGGAGAGARPPGRLLRRHCDQSHAPSDPPAFFRPDVALSWRSSVARWPSGAPRAASRCRALPRSSLGSPAIIKAHLRMSGGRGDVRSRRTGHPGQQRRHHVRRRHRLAPACVARSFPPGLSFTSSPRCSQLRHSRACGHNCS